MALAINVGEWYLDALRRKHHITTRRMLLAGLDSMGEGGDFPMAKNVACLAWTWAWDKLEQAMNRVHRITSPEDVHFYGLICDGSIDRRLEDLWHEKGESQELVLDGKLLGEGDHEVNLAELLHTAVAEFDPSSRTVCEKKLSAEWPQLQQQLGAAARSWTTGHPTHEQTQTPSPTPPQLALPGPLVQPDLPAAPPAAHPAEVRPLPANIVPVDFRTPYVNPISAAWRKQMTVAKLATPSRFHWNQL